MNFFKIPTKKILFALTTILSLGVALTSLRYLSFEQQDLLLGKPTSLFDALWYKVSFYSHISLGIFALFLGPFQFIESIRKKHIAKHRLIGKVYILSIILSAPAGFIIAFFSEGGMVASIGFMSMATVWLFTTIKAWLSIINGDIASHEKWMIRSFAVTLSAVSLRLGLLFMALGFEFDQIYRIVAWSSWLGNLLIAELFIIKNERGK